MLVTCALVYLLVGSLIWLFLDWAGIVKSSYRARLARGEPTTWGGLTLATVFVIVGWPMFVSMWIKGARGMR
jgi:hypothetical protein